MFEVAVAVMIGMLFLIHIWSLNQVNQKEKGLMSEIQLLRDRLEGAKGQLETQIEDILEEIDETVSDLSGSGGNFDIMEMLEMQKAQFMNQIMGTAVNFISKKFGGGEATIAQIENPPDVQNIQKPSAMTDDYAAEKRTT